LFKTFRFKCYNDCTPKTVIVLISEKILGAGDVRLVRIETASTLTGEILEWMYVDASVCTSAEDVCVEFTAEVERSGKYVDVKILEATLLR